jgi:hypothetical protein
MNFYLRRTVWLVRRDQDSGLRFSLPDPETFIMTGDELTRRVRQGDTVYWVGNEGERKLDGKIMARSGRRVVIRVLEAAGAAGDGRGDSSAGLRSDEYRSCRPYDAGSERRWATSDGMEWARRGYSWGTVHLNGGVLQKKLVRRMRRRGGPSSACSRTSRRASVPRVDGHHVQLGRLIPACGHRNRFRDQDTRRTSTGKAEGTMLPDQSSVCLPRRTVSLPFGRSYRSSESRPAEADTAGLTGTSVPVRIHAPWFGAKRGASNPSLISRVTAKRLNTVGGRNTRVLSEKPSVAVSMLPSTAEMIPSPFWSTCATSAAYATSSSHGEPITLSVGRSTCAPVWPSTRAGTSTSRIRCCVLEIPLRSRAHVRGYPSGVYSGDASRT